MELVKKSEIYVVVASFSIILSQLLDRSYEVTGAIQKLYHFIDIGIR